MSTTAPDAPIYYFGCRGAVGHYLYAPNDWQTYRSVGPFTTEMLDGGPFMPPSQTLSFPTVQDEAATESIYWHEEWTVMSVWDRTVDRRPGSHSTFVAPGKHLATGMWRLAAVHFRDVVERLGTRRRIDL